MFVCLQGQLSVPFFFQIMSVWSILCFVYLRNGALFVLLCDAVARGLIQPLCRPDSIEPAPPADRSKNRPEKGMEKAASGQGVFLDPFALQDVRKALEVCQFVCNELLCGYTKPLFIPQQRHLYCCS